MTMVRTYRSSGSRWRSISARPRSVSARRNTAGLTLIEMLVVLGIIGILSAVLVPAAVRNGWFTSSKATLGARELFTLLKAASVYSSTYNVETALAYGGRIVTDSETGALVPVVDQLVLARRLKREEINALLEVGAPNITPNASGSFRYEYYVPVMGPEGVFRQMPNLTCIIPDLFEVVESTEPGVDYISNRGLMNIQLYDPATGDLLEPRFDQDAGSLDYVLNNTLVPSFPAHIFKPGGSMVVPAGHRQRFRVRTGVMPDQGFSDRFFVNPDGPGLDPREIAIVFNEFDPSGDPPVTDLFFSQDPDIPADTLADVDQEIELFAATGRIKLVP